MTVIRRLSKTHNFRFRVTLRVELTTRSILPEDHIVKPRIQEDILLPCAEHVLHACTNGVWRLDEQSGSHIRWYVEMALAYSSLVDLNRALSDSDSHGVRLHGNWRRSHSICNG